MRKIIPLIFSIFLSIALLGQADGGWGNCEFATVAAMNAFNPSSSNLACKKVFVQVTNEHYRWDGTSWVLESQDVENIYNTSNNLTGNRVIGLNSNNLTFDGISDVIIQSDGDVGIGTSPTTELDVNGIGLFRNGNNQSSFTKDQIQFGYNSGSTYRHTIKSRHNSGSSTNNALDFYLWEQGTNTLNEVGTEHVMTLDGSNNGSVGIGTTSPDAKLDIEGGNVRFSDYGTGTYQTGNETRILGVEIDGDIVEIDPSTLGGGSSTNIYNTSAALTADRVVDLDNNDLTFDGSGTGDVIIEADGDVGIGTLTPTQKLDIAGAHKVQIGTFDGSGGGKLRVDVAASESENQALKTMMLRTSGTNYAVNGTAAGSGADTNTGLYGWASGATNNYGLRVDSGYGIFDDKVGIGTTSPEAQLEVTFDRNPAFTVAEPDDGTNTFLSSIVGINTNASNWSRALTALTPNVADGGISGLLTFGQGDSEGQAGHMYFVDEATAGDEYIGFGIRSVIGNILTLNGAGDVGIGTTTPDAKLDVEGGNVRFSDYGDGTQTGTVAYYLAVTTDGDVIEVNSLPSSNNNVSTITTVTTAFNGTRQNNWSPTGLAAAPPFEVYRINATSNTDLTGINSTGVVDGQKMTLLNVGTNRIRLKNQNNNSTAANRIITPSSGNKDVNANSSITLIYDATSTRWRIFSVGE